ncbi:MAG: hypothetical protein ACJAUC_004842 [Planctomycetota bacterium]|jgi:hypothetical protein
MTLASPQFLWALLLLPLMWWLSQPPKPRRQVLTAHMQQWQLAMRALRRRPPRGSWLRFVLLALATIGATLAAAQPFVASQPGPIRLVVLLDASASMAAESVGVSAFEQAKQALKMQFARLPKHIEVTVLRCGGELRRRHGTAARALQDLGEPGGALQVDLSELAQQTANDDCVVWTLTDGQGSEQLPSMGALTRLDTRGSNAAIDAIRILDAWPLPALRLEVDMVAYPAAGLGDRVSAELQVLGATTDEQRYSCSLRSGMMLTRTVLIQRDKRGGQLVVQLVMADDRLPADHRFVLTLPPLPAPRIAALAEADAATFANAAASALAEEVGGEVVAITSDASVGMLLVDGGLVPLMGGDGLVAKRRALTFGTRLTDSVEPELWRSPSPLDWSRSSPLTVGLDLSELRIDRAWRGILPAGEPFLWRQDGDLREPLGVLVDGGDTASMHLAFRLQDSNLPLLPAFPQLLRRAFVRSYGEAATSIASPIVSPASERDLSVAAARDDRPLPDFAAAEQGLAQWFVLAGLLALALRAFVR